MKCTLYNIEMQTPLGKRTGQLLLIQDGTAVEGWLEMLSKRDSIHGTWNGKDFCEFHGYINSLIRKIPFTAFCQKKLDRVEIQLTTEDNVFIVYGREF